MKLNPVRMGLAALLAAAAASLIAFTWLPAKEAYAHANLARSAPAPNSTLVDAPSQAVI